MNLKIDSNVKKRAQKRAADLGMSLSSIVNVTLKQFARTGELELSAAPKATAYLENLIKEAREEHDAGRTSGPFTSADKMIRSLES